MAEYKFDIFKLLDKLNTKDRNYFLNLSEQDKKGIQPLVLMRWMSGTKNTTQINLLNEIVNSKIFSVSKHKQLLLDLLQICGPGKSCRYTWNKLKNNKKTNMQKTIDLIKEYYQYSTLEAKKVIDLLSDDDIIEFANYLGKQPDEIKVINKELKTRT